MKMDEQEKIQNLKLKKAEVEQFERDIANKERELKDFAYRIEQANAEISYLEAEAKVFAEVVKVMMANYGKVPSKIEHLWEEKPEYWALMKEKQLLDNERNARNRQQQIRQLQKTITSSEDQIHGIGIALKMQEDSLAMAQKEYKALEGE